MRKCSCFKPDQLKIHLSRCFTPSLFDVLIMQGRAKPFKNSCFPLFAQPRGRKVSRSDRRIIYHKLTPEPPSINQAHFLLFSAFTLVGLEGGSMRICLLVAECVLNNGALLAWQFRRHPEARTSIGCGPVNNFKSRRKKGGTPKLDRTDQTS